MPPQIEMEINPQVCLTEIDENGDRKNRVGMKIAERNLVIVEQLPEEGIYRRTESAEIEVLKNDQFAVARLRESVAGCSPTADGGFGPIATSLATVAWVLTDFVHSSFNSASRGFCLLSRAIVLLLKLLLHYGYGMQRI
jgi:hypothetical protein